MRMLVCANRHIRQLRRHHCPLAFAQVPAMQIQADDIALVLTIATDRRIAVT